jgi:hypothetical protein
LSRTAAVIAIFGYIENHVNIQDLCLYNLIAHINAILSDHELSLVFILPISALFLEILKSLMDLRCVVKKEFGQFLVLKGFHV